MTDIFCSFFLERFVAIDSKKNKNVKVIKWTKEKCVTWNEKENEKKKLIFLFNNWITLTEIGA